MGRNGAIDGFSMEWVCYFVPDRTRLRVCLSLILSFLRLFFFHRHCCLWLKRARNLRILDNVNNLEMR